MDTIPHWMKDHEESDQRNFDNIRQDFDDLKNSLSRIEIQLAPISESYRAASTLGKWGMSAMVALSVFIGIVLSLRALFFK